MTQGIGTVFAHANYVWQFNAACNTALSDAKYPVSGAFADLTGYERIHILIIMGTIADALVFTPQAVSAIDGTPADIDTTYMEKTIAATDDGQIIEFVFETRKLPTLTDQFFTLDVTGTSGNNYAAIIAWGEGRPQPVTQSTTVLPTDNVLAFVGGHGS